MAFDARAAQQPPGFKLAAVAPAGLFAQQQFPARCVLVEQRHEGVGAERSDSTIRLQLPTGTPMLVETNATKRHNLIPRDTISYARSTRRGWHKIADVGRMKRMSERRQDQEGGMTTRITS